MPTGRLLQQDCSRQRWPTSQKHFSIKKHLITSGVFFWIQLN
jgi:hypothetical protein